MNARYIVEPKSLHNLSISIEYQYTEFKKIFTVNIYQLQTRKTFSKFSLYTLNGHDLNGDRKTLLYSTSGLTYDTR